MGGAGPGASYFLFVDGSVRFIPSVSGDNANGSYTQDSIIFQALGTRFGKRSHPRRLGQVIARGESVPANAYRADASAGSSSHSHPTGCVHACCRCPLKAGSCGGRLDVTTART